VAEKNAQAVAVAVAAALFLLPDRCKRALEDPAAAATAALDPRPYIEKAQGLVAGPGHNRLARGTQREIPGGKGGGFGGCFELFFFFFFFFFFLARYIDTYSTRIEWPVRVAERQ
jgi:hypothetical protein